MIGESIGTYKILRELGAGGMGTVYLAQHQVIGRLVAIKLLLPSFSSNEEMVARMFNEARLAAHIRHPGLVEVYDFGRLSDGSAYIVMEYLEGETVSAMLARGALPGLELTLALVRQVATAVGAAHEKGIIHRDLKPDNIFVVADDDVDVGVRARILDFGIAKLSAELQGGGLHTRTGAIMGTPLYMSPEQCRGAGNVDWRTDIYSLGCILYEMVTGVRLFNLEGLGEIIGAHLHSPPPPPSRVNARVPAWLDAVVLKLLAKDPAARYQSMAEVVVALGGKPRRRTSLVPAPPGDAAHPVQPSKPPTTLGRSNGEMGFGGRLRSRPRTAAVAGALLVAGGLAVFLALRGGSAAPADEPRPATVAPPSTVVAAESKPPALEAPKSEALKAELVKANLAPPPAVLPPPPTPERIVLKIRSQPEGADVYRDGGKIGVTPLDYPLAPVAGSIVFELKLAGYASKRLTMRSDSDAEETVRLSAASVPQPAKKKKSKDTMDPFEE